MKHVLLTVTIIFGIIACTKESEKKKCWECTNTKFYSTGGNDTQKDTVCNMTKDEMVNYSKINTRTYPIGPNTTVNERTHCVEQK